LTVGFDRKDAKGLQSLDLSYCERAFCPSKRSNQRKRQRGPLAFDFALCFCSSSHLNNPVKESRLLSERTKGCFIFDRNL
jgi:hypothetical protein